MNRRLTYTLLSLVGLVLVGATGYTLIEGWNFFDAVYMTVITITSVGFGEVKPLHPAGRAFTILIIFAGVALASSLISSIVDQLLSDEARARWQMRKRLRMIDQLSRHVIVCGYGKVGKSVSRTFRSEGIPCVVVETDASTATQCELDGFTTMCGNASDENMLTRLGIERARALVACVNTDAENVFIVLTARALRSDLYIVARANVESTIPKLKRAGANRVIVPYDLGGQRIANMVIRPGVADFLDSAMHAGSLELRIEEVTIDGTSKLVDRSMKDLKLREEHGITVLAIASPNSEYKTSPGPEDRLAAGGRVIVLGTPPQLKSFERAAK